MPRQRRQPRRTAEPDRRTVKHNDRTYVALLRELRRALRRRRRPLTLENWAEKSGVSRTMISYILRQLRVPTLNTLVPMARVLGLRLGFHARGKS